MSDREINILSIIPQMEDATSFYRGSLPLGELRHHRIKAIYPSRVTWAITALADIVFLQRPFTPEHLSVAELADKMRKPLWMDFDDDLFTVPDDNFSHHLYGHEMIQKNVATLAAIAWQVTVSTSALAARFDEIRRRAGKPRCVVVPNALPDFLAERGEPPAPRRKAIFWRGSMTHMRDLMTVSREILEFMRAHEDWSIHFMGYNPFWITAKLSKAQCAVAPSIDILDYLAYVRQIQPGIMIAPLHDSPFNRAKSNIAWLEGSRGYAQVIAPHFREWAMPGVRTYVTPSNFREELELAARDVEKNCSKHADASWAHITDTLLLSKTNLKRAEVVQSLLESHSNKGELKNVSSYECHYPSAGGRT